MLKRFGNIIVGLELLAMAILCLLTLLAMVLGPPPEEPFSLLSKVQHLLAIFAVLSLTYLGAGYIRSKASDFLFRWDLSWCSAIVLVGFVLFVSIASILGYNGIDGFPPIDVYLALLTIPLVHYVILGLVGRRLTIVRADAP